MDGHFPKCLFNVGVCGKVGMLWLIGANVGAERVNVWLDVGSAGRTAEAVGSALAGVVTEVVYPAILDFGHDEVKSSCRARERMSRLLNWG